MKKVLMLAALVAAAGSFMAIGTAGADPGGGATVFRADGLCAVNLSGGLATYPCTYQRVETPSGAIHYWSKGQLAPADVPAATEAFDNASTGQFCIFDAQDFKGVATKSGNISFQCRN
jgi:hypothetical protein